MLNSFKSLAIDLILPLFSSFAVDSTALVQEGPVVVVSPHPDDDILSCGAAISLARNAGQRLVVIFVTDGSNSSRSRIVSPQQLSALRHAEALKALAVLGCEADDVIFLDIPDSTGISSVEVIAERLAEHLETIRPRLILSSYGIDPHPDHRAAAFALDQLATQGRLGCRVLEYPRFQPRTALSHLLNGKLRGRFRKVRAADMIARKRLALAEHRSQCENLTGEPDWQILPAGWLKMFFQPWELYIEKQLYVAPDSVPRGTITFSPWEAGR